MRKTTQAWLDAARDDLSVIEAILSRPDLTHMVAFHSQQCVEKTMKALIEESERSVRKTHNITQLIGTVAEEYRTFSDFDTTVPTLLDQLYTDSRYPNEFGLLPEGKPTLKEAAQFHAFAQQVFSHGSELLGVV